MNDEEKIFDSPRDWVSKHIQDYVESDGQDGHIWNGVPTLLLITRGRKTGKRRRTALIYGRDGENYIIVASRGGHPHHPAWYLNLSENPEVEVQIEDKKFTALARTAQSQEKERLWKVMASIWPAYNDYQQKTGRDIPVIVLEPSRSTKAH